MTLQVPDEIGDMPPGTKLVYLVLEDWDGWVSIDELVAGTGMSERAIRYALTRLDKEGVIQRRCDVKDARRRLYTTRTSSC